MNPRQRRLQGDYAELRRKFDGNPHLVIEPVGPAPYERYRIVFRLPSLRLDTNNQPVVVPSTVVDIALPSRYPREKPYATTVDRVFHPNFGEYICLADYWSPAQSLADIVTQIAEMLQWQRYNVRSPLNAVAAEWVRTHPSEVPVGTVVVGEPEVVIAIGEIKETQ